MNEINEALIEQHSRTLKLPGLRCEILLGRGLSVILPSWRQFVQLLRTQRARIRGRNLMAAAILRRS